MINTVKNRGCKPGGNKPMLIYKIIQKTMELSGLA